MLYEAFESWYPVLFQVLVQLFGYGDSSLLVATMDDDYKQMKEICNIARKEIYL